MSRLVDLDEIPGTHLAELASLKIAVERRQAEQESAQIAEDHWHRVDQLRQAAVYLLEEFGPTWSERIADALELRACRLGLAITWAHLVMAELDLREAA